MVAKRKDINPLEEAETPLSFRFHILSKKYVSAVAHLLERIDMERHFYTLSIIENNGSVTQQCLANCLEIDKASVVRIIDYLTEKGLVERVKNPDDRRAHLIVATNKAKKNLLKINNAFGEINRAAFKGFTKKEQNHFIEMSNKIMQNLIAFPTNGTAVKSVKKGVKK